MSEHEPAAKLREAMGAAFDRFERDHRAAVAAASSVARDILGYIHAHLDADEQAATTDQERGRVGAIRDALKDMEWIACRETQHPDARDHARGAIRAIAGMWGTVEELEQIPDPDNWPGGFHRAKIEQLREEGTLS
ncbi:hypothetical protein [Sphaerisporangium aureirubrum]|uniref:Uncharacterized protein n=1 Tax=Sphaerisporangium aureirubrum TaxID=1544736 RepID=A0ABW1NCE5_9ACTN